MQNSRASTALGFSVAMHCDLWFVIISSRITMDFESNHNRIACIQIKSSSLSNWVVVSRDLNWIAIRFLRFCPSLACNPKLIFQQSQRYLLGASRSGVTVEKQVSETKTKCVRKVPVYFGHMQGLQAIVNKREREREREREHDVRRPRFCNVIVLILLAVQAWYNWCTTCTWSTTSWLSWLHPCQLQTEWWVSID